MVEGLLKSSSSEVEADGRGPPGVVVERGGRGRRR